MSGVDAVPAGPRFQANDSPIISQCRSHLRSRLCNELRRAGNISSLVVDVVPKHSLGTVFSVVATGSTIGGIVMNMIAAAMVSGPSTKPAGFLDQGIKTVFGPLLEMVQGHGYGHGF